MTPVHDSLHVQIADLASEWALEAELWRLNKGQHTRPKTGHEVLANCAAILAELVKIHDPDA